MKKNLRLPFFKATRRNGFLHFRFFKGKQNFLKEKLKIFRKIKYKSKAMENISGKIHFYKGSRLSAWIGPHLCLLHLKFCAKYFCKTALRCCLSTSPHITTAPRSTKSVRFGLCGQIKN